MEIKYDDVEDVPLCDCHGKPCIDLHCLGQYSTKILVAIVQELSKAKKQVEREERTRTVFQYPGVLADEVGVRNFMESPRAALADVEEKLKLVRDELKRRKNDTNGTKG